MIVCEVGLNHQGDEQYSFEYIKQLNKTKCDAITYQIRENSFYESDDYKHIKLPLSHYSELISITHKNNKKFGVALAEHSLIDKCEELGVDFYKVLSWDLKNYDFIDDLLETKKPIYVSTGMSPIEEIDEFCDRYNKYYFTDRITLIHTQLSFGVEDVNLKAIPFLDNFSPFPVAFGNHCENLNVLYTSLGFNPSDIFMYVKNKKDIKHIDEKHSVRLAEVGDMVGNMIELKKSLGEAIKLKIEKRDKYLIQNVEDN